MILANDEFRFVLQDSTLWIRVLCAVLCGGIVGLERTLGGKPAGLRTNMLICLGATIFVLAQELITRQGGNTADHSRIAAQVVTGIGFIGAGAIIRQGLSVHGLTSAATIWVVAAIGVVIGIGYPLTGIAITLCTVLILVPLGFLEKRFIERNGRCDEGE